MFGYPTHGMRLIFFVRTVRVRLISACLTTRPISFLIILPADCGAEQPAGRQPNGGGLHPVVILYTKLHTLPLGSFPCG